MNLCSEISIKDQIDSLLKSCPKQEDFEFTYIYEKRACIWKGPKS